MNLNKLMKQAQKMQEQMAKTQAELEGRGVPISRAAQQEPWGLHELHVTDPDHVTLIFVQVPDTHPLRRDTRS